MAPRPVWWHTLQEARRQACTAIDFYNRAGDRACYLDFVVHMHLAWQNLLHASLTKQRRDIYYRETNGRFKRGKDGEKRTWDLTKCLQESYADNDPIRANVTFFVGLRNRIEHRYQRALMMGTAPHAHALVVNFEAELTRLFGDGQSLADELRFPVFVQSLTPAGMDEQRALRRGIPKAVRSYITDFEAALAAEVRDDERYFYRVLMTPMKGSRTEADMAVTFVRQDQLTGEQMQDMVQKSGTVVVAEKFRSVALADEMLPGKAAVAIDAALPYKFSTNDFTRLRQHLEVGPKGKARLRKTEDKWCIFVKANGVWVYTPAFVERCVGLVDTEEKFRSVIGRAPRYKPGQQPRPATEAG